MASATVTVTSPADGYHRITVTGPTNGDITTIPEIYTAIQALADVPSRACMELINVNTYSVKHITALSVTGTYTQFYINPSVRVELPSTTALVFSQSSTALTNTSIYLSGQFTCSSGSLIDNKYANSNGNRYIYLLGGCYFSGSAQYPITIKNGSGNFFYNSQPSKFYYMNLVDNATYALYLSYVGYVSSAANTQFKNLKIYNQTLTNSVTTGINLLAGGMFNNVTIDGFQIYSINTPLVLGGSSIKLKNGYIHDCYRTAISITIGGGVVSPSYETSKDDTLYPSGRFQSFLSLQNITIENFGKIPNNTMLYGMLIDYSSLVYLKNCNFIKTDGLRETFRRPLGSRRNSIVIQYGTGSGFQGHTTYPRVWTDNGTFLRGREVDIEVKDEFNNPITNSTITVIQGSVPAKQKWYGMTNQLGKLVNIFGDPMVLIQKQQVSSGSFQSWSDGSSEALKHIFTFTAPGYEMYQTTSTITQDKNWVITLYPPSQPSVATDIPGIQIGQGIVF